MMDDIGWMESSQAKQEERAPKNPKNGFSFCFKCLLTDVHPFHTYRRWS